MDPHEFQHELRGTARNPDEITVLLRRILVSIDEQQGKDQLLADLHSRFLTLHDDTLRTQILKPFWEDLLLLHDRIVRQQQILVAFPARPPLP